jgi:hypothetical protein
MQSLILLGSLVVAVVVAVVLVLVGAPQWIAIPAGVFTYLVCWRFVLRTIRRRGEADAERDAG